jgi:1-acyl-sn-glycerol-3-phosphate acyltransferase
MIPLITLFPKKKGSIMHHLNQVIIFLLGGKLEQEGIIDKDADLFVMNHQGIVDIIGMEALQKGHLRWVAKKETFNMPWFGYLLRNGDMISVDREDKKGLLKLIRDVKESINVKKRAVAIFPEGTRSKDQKLLPFKSGTKFIATKLSLKVQPVVITGSKYLFNEHEQTGHNATVRYIYLPIVDVKNASDEWYGILQKNMQETIDGELADHNRSR